MKKKWIIVLLILITIGLLAFILKSPSKVQNVSPAQTHPTLKANSSYYYPLADYFSRIKVKSFGQLVKTWDKFDIPCGAAFSGYHDGDDLETTPAEANIDVEVHAVAAGKVLQIGHVNGYGGLLVQSASLAGQEVTIYYGHINYMTAKVKNGDSVTPNEVLAYLGKGCSSETDGERKHLHFAIHKGTAVDVRGYVPDQSILSNWLNPGETLKTIGTASP